MLETRSLNLFHFLPLILAAFTSQQLTITNILKGDLLSFPISSFNLSPSTPLQFNPDDGQGISVENKIDGEWDYGASAFDKVLDVREMKSGNTIITAVALLFDTQYKQTTIKIDLDKDGNPTKKYQYVDEEDILLGHYTCKSTTALLYSTQSSFKSLVICLSSTNNILSYLSKGKERVVSQVVLPAKGYLVSKIGERLQRNGGGELAYFYVETPSEVKNASLAAPYVVVLEFDLSGQFVERIIDLREKGGEILKNTLAVDYFEMMLLNDQLVAVTSVRKINEGGDVTKEQNLCLVNPTSYTMECFNTKLNINTVTLVQITTESGPASSDPKDKNYLLHNLVYTETTKQYQVIDLAFTIRTVDSQRSLILKDPSAPVDYTQVKLPSGKQFTLRTVQNSKTREIIPAQSASTQDNPLLNNHFFLVPMQDGKYSQIINADVIWAKASDAVPGKIVGMKSSREIVYFTQNNFVLSVNTTQLVPALPSAEGSVDKVVEYYNDGVKKTLTLKLQTIDPKLRLAAAPKAKLTQTLSSRLRRVRFNIDSVIGPRFFATSEDLKNSTGSVVGKTYNNSFSKLVYLRQNAFNGSLMDEISLESAFAIGSKDTLISLANNTIMACKSYANDLEKSITYVLCNKEMKFSSQPIPKIKTIFGAKLSNSHLAVGYFKNSKEADKIDACFIRFNFRTTDRMYYENCFLTNLPSKEPEQNQLYTGRLIKGKNSYYVMVQSEDDNSATSLADIVTFYYDDKNPENPVTTKIASKLISLYSASAVAVSPNTNAGVDLIIRATTGITLLTYKLSKGSLVSETSRLSRSKTFYKEEEITLGNNTLYVDNYAIGVVGNDEDRRSLIVKENNYFADFDEVIDFRQDLAFVMREFHKQFSKLPLTKDLMANRLRNNAVFSTSTFEHYSYSYFTSMDLFFVSTPASPTLSPIIYTYTQDSRPFYAQSTTASSPLTITIQTASEGFPGSKLSVESEVELVAEPEEKKMSDVIVARRSEGKPGKYAIEYNPHAGMESGDKVTRYAGHFWSIDSDMKNVSFVQRLTPTSQEAWMERVADCHSLRTGSNHSVCYQDDKLVFFNNGTRTYNGNATYGLDNKLIDILGISQTKDANGKIGLIVRTEGDNGDQIEMGWALCTGDECTLTWSKDPMLVGEIAREDSRIVLNWIGMRAQLYIVLSRADHTLFHLDIDMKTRKVTRSVVSSWVEYFAALDRLSNGEIISIVVCSISTEDTLIVKVRSGGDFINWTFDMVDKASSFDNIGCVWQDDTASCVFAGARIYWADITLDIQNKSAIVSKREEYTPYKNMMPTHILPMLSSKGREYFLIAADRIESNIDKAFDSTGLMVYTALERGGSSYLSGGLTVHAMLGMDVGSTFTLSVIGDEYIGLSTPYKTIVLEVAQPKMYGDGFSPDELSNSSIRIIGSEGEVNIKLSAWFAGAGDGKHHSVHKFFWWIVGIAIALGVLVLLATCLCFLHRNKENTKMNEIYYEGGEINSPHHHDHLKSSLMADKSVNITHDNQL